MSRRARPGLAVAALAALALLSGCSGFPGKGPVLQGPRVDVADPGVAAFAQPPGRGAGPEGIVRGFLRAGEDVHEDHRMARLFLEAPQTPWNPGQGVVVLAQAPEVTLESPTGPSSAATRGAQGAKGTDAAARGRPQEGDRVRVRVTGTVAFRVDESGVMALPTAGGVGDRAPAFSADYALVMTREGEWRIDLPAPGLVLTRDEFSNAFRSVRLYFADATQHWLVPDVRWFPYLDRTDQTPIATLAVKALLQGPSPWLAPPRGSPGMVVQSGAPPGTKLTAVAGVQIAGSTVRVDLTRNILNSQEDQRRWLQAQLQATFADLMGANQVELTSNQGSPVYTKPGLVPRDVLEVRAQQARDDDPTARGSDVPPGAGGALCTTSKGRIGQLDRSGGASTCSDRKDLAPFYREGHTLALPASDGISGVVAALDGLPRNPQGSVVAAVPAEAAPARPVPVLTSPTPLSAPDVDVDGWVWAASDGRMLAGRIGGGQREVTAPWLAGARLQAVRISPEGARALIVFTRAGRTQAVVTGVVRDKDGSPTAFTGQMPVVGDLTRGVDAGWTGDADVAVLGSRPGDDDLFVLGGTVGGEGLGGTVGGKDSQKLANKPAPADATGLAVSGTVDIYLRTQDGKALALSTGEWKPLDVRDLTLPD